MNVLSLENFKVEIEGKIRSTTDDMRVEAGEVCALVGRNGSGKSSLLSGIMTTIGTAAYGKGTILDQDIESTSLDEKARSGIIYITQKQPEIEGLSLIQLLYGMYLRSTDKPSTIIEYKNKLSKELDSYGLNSELLMRNIGVGLSGGEKKQTELITLIASNPKVILMDEIDSGVDLNTLDIIASVISKLQSLGAGIMIVSHNFELLQRLKPAKIYLAEDGIVKYHGDLKTLNDLRSKGFVVKNK